MGDVGSVAPLKGENAFTFPAPTGLKPPEDKCANSVGGDSGTGAAAAMGATVGSNARSVVGGGAALLGSEAAWSGEPYVLITALLRASRRPRTVPALRCVGGGAYETSISLYA